MTEHLLLSESFSGVVRNARDPYGNPIPEIQEPAGWVAFYRDGNGYHKPEMLRIDHSNPNYLRPVNRLNAQGYGLKVFKPWGKLDCGYYRQVVVPAGITELQATLTGHCWYSQLDDPAASQWVNDNGLECPVTEGMRLWIGVDPTGGTDPRAESVVWTGDEIFDEHADVTVTAPDPGDLATVFICTDNDNQFKHVDAYFAGVSVVGFSQDDPPPPDPDPVDYAVVVNLLPQDATKAEFAHVLDATYADRESIVYSADDAARLVAPGKLPGSRVIAWAPERWGDTPPIWDWLGERGVGIVETRDFPGAEPPAGGDPQPGEPQYTLPTRNLVGLHMQEPKTDWPVYYRDAHPAVYKAVDQLGMVIEAKRAYSDTLAVFRRYVFNDGGWVDDPDGPDKLLDIYEATFDAHRHNAHEEPLDYVDVIESVNETYAWDYDRNMRALDFDLRFADGARARFGHAVDAGILTIAIGNPPIEQVGPVLLEAARKSYEDGHWLAYHAYWTANGSRPDPPYLLQHLDYHAGRWMRWDDVFRSAGVYPRYYLGEGGIVYANDPAGTDFASGRGWKSCGPFCYYIQQLDLYNQMLADWNARHGNRCRGLTVFCYGGGRDWRDFDWEPGDLYALRDWAVTL